MVVGSEEWGHRIVLEEPQIPFEPKVIYEDRRIIVVDKPHFLATMPRGMWYEGTVLIRMRQQYGEPDIIPAHRLDRATAGVLVLVRDPAARRAYQMLFQEHRVRKVYQCLAPVRPILHPRTGTVQHLDPPRVFPLERRSRVIKRRGILQAWEERGPVNAITRVELTAGQGCLATYTLYPQTGKTHQLRVHMNALGLPIVGDDLYPRIQTRAYDDFSRPLQLVARRLEFTDPFTGVERIFTSSVPLEPQGEA
ncbi:MULTISPECIES: pseudouridine synthase [Bifidobacterium]|uniref:pseudouridine synthase n=1 Tax=Bifidobacterium TaxID=1678 RepID=UPI0018DB44A7|nr:MULTISPECIES: pseudouridine synthase [Bifidobacterium]MBI0145559.1 23S rRNA pseudouridylate synthase [Bifidobacterium polysaccharolyticum]MBI0152381.1 23S rRNA pseudouridylate synthase [Bifidobacterium sp. M0399]